MQGEELAKVSETSLASATIPCHWTNGSGARVFDSL
jgi:hypothetical protein